VVGHGDEKQVQRGTAAVAAVNQVVLYERLWPPARICRNLAGLKMLVVFETANMEFAGNHVMNKQ